MLITEYSRYLRFCRLMTVAWRHSLIFFPKINFTDFFPVKMISRKFTQTHISSYERWHLLLRIHRVQIEILIGHFIVHEHCVRAAYAVPVATEICLRDEMIQAIHPKVWIGCLGTARAATTTVAQTARRCCLVLEIGICQIRITWWGCANQHNW